MLAQPGHLIPASTSTPEEIDNTPKIRIILFLCLLLT